MVNDILYIDQLPLLINILDDINVDYDNISNENKTDLQENILHLIYEFVDELPDILHHKYFNEIIIDELWELLTVQFNNEIYLNNDFEQEIENIIFETVELFAIYNNIEFIIYEDDEDDENNENNENNNTNYIIDDSNNNNNNTIENIENNNTIENIENNNTIENIENNNTIENIENTIIVNEYNMQNSHISLIESTLTYVRSKYQPEQRTQEWHDVRYQLITGSSTYKVFGTQSLQNQLIYEKCKPKKCITHEDTNIKIAPNVNSPLHWGQKYEPVSVLLYEHKYKTKIEDFGCIKHDDYDFIGASPDGINVLAESELFGVMLEIKNPVSRQITGVPLNEYWIQMQIQMEVCNLDKCDFYETKFVEYDTMLEFNNDVYSNKVNDYFISKTENIKGSIIYFVDENLIPIYIYKPIHIITQEQLHIWEEEQIELYQTTYNYTYIKILYWKLDKCSCVRINRDVKWFNSNVYKIKQLWDTIVNERIHGYEHRAPKKRIVKNNLKKQIENTPAVSKCLLPIHIKKIP
jgi:putative phage-type endonuclease